MEERERKRMKMEERAKKNGEERERKKMKRMERRE